MGASFHVSVALFGAMLCLLSSSPFTFPSSGLFSGVAAQDMSASPEKLFPKGMASQFFLADPPQANFAGANCQKYVVPSVEVWTQVAQQIKAFLDLKLEGLGPQKISPKRFVAIFVRAAFHDAGTHLKASGSSSKAPARRSLSTKKGLDLSSRNQTGEVLPPSPSTAPSAVPERIDSSHMTSQRPAVLPATSSSGSGLRSLQQGMIEGWQRTPSGWKRVWVPAPTPFVPGSFKPIGGSPAPTPQPTPPPTPAPTTPAPTPSPTPASTPSRAGGADGSLVFAPTEASFLGNTLPFPFVPYVRGGLIDVVEKFKISWADAIAVAGAVASNYFNEVNPTEFKLDVGRCDNLEANPVEALPPPWFTLDQVVAYFSSLGLTIPEGAALMGSHVIMKDNDPNNAASGGSQMFRWTNKYYTDGMAGTTKVVGTELAATVQWAASTKWQYTPNDALISFAATKKITAGAGKDWSLAMRDFALDEDKWVKVYAEAYRKLTDVGATFATGKPKEISIPAFPSKQ